MTAVPTGLPDKPGGVELPPDESPPHAVSAIVVARILALKGKLNDVEYKQNDLFHVNVPQSCPDVPTEILNPEDTWADKNAYKETAEKLASQFAENYEKNYGQQDIAERVMEQCPGVCLCEA